ncbi:MAG TPA: hypothetical protein VFG69_05880 [Nannocystaceae bacterium]|nr:hypothetical protein [Nannocystaceae bacterium]
MAKARKSVAKSDFVEKNLAAALERLEVAAAAGRKAVTARSRDGKKFAATVKRLAKRRASLVRRKKLASRRARKSPSGESRKALRSVVKELATTTKALAKAKGIRVANASELAALKPAHRRATGYSRAIAQIDRALRRAKK